MNLLKTMAAAALLASAAFSASAQPAAQKLIPLKVAYDGYSMTTAPMNYAVQKGIFKKYGLDVTLAYIDAGTTLSQAVVGGSINIAQNGYAPAAAAAVQGADVVFIGGISNQLPFQLVVKGNIKSAADLKGKKIAISRFGASSDIAANSVAHFGSEAHRCGAAAIGRGGHAHRRHAVGPDRRLVRTISAHGRTGREGLSRAGRLSEDRGRLSQHLLCFDARLREPRIPTS